MIQILGIREYFHHGKGKTLKKEAFWENDWRAESIQEILEQYPKLVNKIPKEERYNIYFTVASCYPDKGRKLKEQWCIPFDIDGVEAGKEKEVAEIACLAINAEYDKTGSLASGNGVWLFVAIDTPIVSADYFELVRGHYAELCKKINRALQNKGLKGKADPSVWSHARLARMPGTLNRKPDRPERMAFVIQDKAVPISYSLEKESGLPSVPANEQISKTFMAKFPEVDENAVATGCEFLKWSRENQALVNEPIWYAMLGLYAYMPNGGQQMAHDASKAHPGYSYLETEEKLKQARDASGPRTCDSINKMWGRCQECAFFGKQKSPIQITGPEYIKTATTGFHDVHIGADGLPKTGKPNFNDLRDFFNKKYRYVTAIETREVYVYKDGVWTHMTDLELTAFAHDHFKPKVGAHPKYEFVEAVKCQNLRKLSWFSDTTIKKMNFQNGVLDLVTMEIHPHSPEYGFKHKLPYEYNPEATAPVWEKYLNDVMLGDQALINILLEYVGWCFSGDKYWKEKCLFLSGEGENGKSTFIDVIRRLAGGQDSGTFSNLPLGELHAPEKRYLLEGRLFNLAEETSSDAFKDSNIFKNLTGGGIVSVKKLYSQPYEIENRAKFIFACNKLPYSSENTHAFYRRMIIVPFSARFTGQNRDDFMREKLYMELPGIFNTIIKGYQRLVQQKNFSQAKAIDDALQEYKFDSDDALSFFWGTFRRCPEGKNVKIQKQQVYDMYVDWAREKQGLRKWLPQPWFWRRLRTAIPQLLEGRAREGRVIEGFELRDEFEENVVKPNF